MADRSVSIKVDANVSPFQRALARAAASAKAFSKELDTSNDRTAMLVQSAAALGPALTPIGAVAVPAVAGLTSALASGATAAVSAGLAFSGMGDAIESINKYRLEPTSENLEKMKQAMAEVGPAGREFARFIADLKPQFDSLQNLSRSGLFPGLQDGIEEFLEQMPRVKDIVGQTSLAMGELAKEAGGALSGPFWDDFFDFFSGAAASDLTAFGRATGNFAEGLAAMFKAFHPLSQNFSDVLLDWSRSFNEWAQSLEDSQSFQEFLAYIREVSPQVRDSMAALGEAFVDLVKATSEVGPHVLNALEGIAKLISAIAESPIGPTAIGLLSLVSAFGRLAAIGRLFGGGALGSVFGSFVADVRALPKGLATSTSMIVSLGSGMERTSKNAADLDERMKTVRRTLGTIGKLGAIGGLATLEATGVAEDLEASNAAMGAMIGLMAGPWGAAAGVVVGSMLDIAAANDKVADAVKTASSALEFQPAAFTQNAVAIESARQSLEDFREAATFGKEDFNLKALIQPFGGLGPEIKNKIEGIFGDSDVEEAERQVQARVSQFTRMAQSISDLNVVMGGTEIPTDDYAALERVVSDLGPAFQAAGYNINDWLGLMRNASTQFYGWAILESIKDDLQAFDDQLDDTINQVQDFQSAMEDAFGGKLNVEEAFLAWRDGLAALRKELKEGKATLAANTQEGRDNRKAILDQAKATQDYVNALKEAGAPQARLNAALRQGADEILNVGLKAGFSRKQMEGYLETLGFTPKQVSTLIKLFGAKQAKRDAEELQGELDKTDRKKANPLVAVQGVARSIAELFGVDTKIAETDKKKATPSVGVVGADAAIGALAGVQSAVNSIDTDITIRVGTSINVGGLIGLQQANGGIVDFYANGGIRRENHVAQIAPAGAWRVWAEPETGGEAYIPLAPSKRQRSRVVAEETVGRLGGRVEWLADGGLRGHRVAPLSASRRSGSREATTLRIVEGDVRVRNWQDGRQHMRLIAEEVVEGDAAYRGARDRMNR